MDPTSAELANMVNLEQILDWALINGDPADEATARGSFLALLGATQCMPPRVIGAMDAATFTNVANTWKIGGAAPSPVLRTMADTFGRVARILSGVTLSQEAIVAQQAQQAVAQAAAIAAQAATAQRRRTRIGHPEASGCV